MERMNRGQFRKFLIFHRTKAEQYVKAICRSWGFKPKFQHIIKPFIVDVYLPSINTVLEIDGSSHDNKEAYDEYRCQTLINKGYMVLRYTNDLVYKYPEEFKKQLRFDLGLPEAGHPNKVVHAYRDLNQMNSIYEKSH